jgi:hypothetical protein
MRTLRLLLLQTFLGMFLLSGAACQNSKPAAVTVYKSPTCGCCSKWVEHLEASGFEVKTTDMENVEVMKDHLGLPLSLASCHTAVVDGYVVEGHVPADVIHQLLEERPAVAGIAVPGMPIGSPGMEGPNPEPYEVIAFTKDGQQSVYARR